MVAQPESSAGAHQRGGTRARRTLVEAVREEVGEHDGVHHVRDDRLVHGQQHAAQQVGRHGERQQR